MDASKDRKRVLYLVLGLCIIVFLLCFIFFYIYAYNQADKGNEEEKKNQEGLANMLTENNYVEPHVDGTLDEFVNNEDLTLESVSSDEDEKVKSSTKFIFRTHYTGSDTVHEEEHRAYYTTLKMTREELQQEYENWEITEFSSERVVFETTEKGVNENEVLYFIIYSKGQIIAYRKDGDNKIESGKIDVHGDRLSEEDLNKYKTGITVNEEELLRIFQNLSS